MSALSKINKALDLVLRSHKIIFFKCIIFFICLCLSIHPSIHPFIHSAGFAVMISNISLHTELVNYCAIQNT